MNETILISRLRQVWSIPEWLQAAMDKVNARTEPCQYEDDEDRPFFKNYDSRRIAYFVHNPIGWSPVSLDQDWHDGNPYGPVLIDGHHRLGAAIRLGHSRIGASCGGTVTMIEWLQGKTQVMPEELR